MSPSNESPRPTLAFAIPGDLSLPTGGYTYDRRVLALLPQLGIDTHHLVLPGSYPSPTAADLDESSHALTDLAPDTVLLIDGLAYGAMPLSLIAPIRNPIVALVHHPLCLEAGLALLRARELHALEKAALGNARHTIVTSPATARTLTADFAVPPDRITVAEPGTDPMPRAPCKGDPPQLLAVGSIVPRKGYDVLIAALATLRTKPWHLTIAGAEDRSPDTAARLRRDIADAGLSTRITMHGAVDARMLASLYVGADIFVMPSLFEGYGMALAEAMACGLPIICTTGGAAAETVPDHAALKVAPGDAPAFAAALARTLDDQALRRRMSDAAWAAGAELPRWKTTAGIIADCIRKVFA